MKFQRNFEAEADYLGLQYMYRRDMIRRLSSVFRKNSGKGKEEAGTLAKAFASHPQTPDRIAASQKEIATILPAKPQYIVSTSEFDDVKSRLATIENRHKVNDEKDGSSPACAAPQAPTSLATDKNGSNDDDRPTLKRRDDNPNQGQQ